VGLDLADVDLGARTLAVVRKGGARVLLELPEPTTAAIAAWVERRGLRPGALFVELMRRHGERQRLAAGGVYFNRAAVG
jgi:site-specific recombinase XerC